MVVERWRTGGTSCRNARPGTGVIVKVKMSDVDVEKMDVDYDIMKG